MPVVPAPLTRGEGALVVSVFGGAVEVVPPPLVVVEVVPLPVVVPVGGGAVVPVGGMTIPPPMPLTTAL